MGCSITQRTCLLSFESASMGLGIIFYQLQIEFLANISNLLRIGTTTIKMNDHHGFGTRCNGSLYPRIINLERIDIGFYQDGR